MEGLENLIQGKLSDVILKKIDVIGQVKKVTAKPIKFVMT